MSQKVINYVNHLYKIYVKTVVITLRCYNIFAFERPFSFNSILIWRNLQSSRFLWIKNDFGCVSKMCPSLFLTVFLHFFFFLGNHKDYNNRRHRELSSPDESIIPPGSRVPLSRSCSSPATATYGKLNENYLSHDTRISIRFCCLNDFIFIVTLFSIRNTTNGIM